MPIIKTSCMSFQRGMTHYHGCVAKKGQWNGSTYSQGYQYARRESDKQKTRPIHRQDIYGEIRKNTMEEVKASNKDLSHLNKEVVNQLNDLAKRIELNSELTGSASPNCYSLKDDSIYVLMDLLQLNELLDEKPLLAKMFPDENVRDEMQRTNLLVNTCIWAKARCNEILPHYLPSRQEVKKCSAFFIGMIDAADDSAMDDDAKDNDFYVAGFNYGGEPVLEAQSYSADGKFQATKRKRSELTPDERGQLGVTGSTGA